MMRRRLCKLLVVPAAMAVVGPEAVAQSCDEALTGLEQRLSEAELDENDQRRVGEMMESARLFRDLEREEGCVRVVQEAGRIVDQIEEGSEVEERAAEQLGRATEADEANPLADVPSYRLIGRMVIGADGEPAGEVVDVSAAGEGERTAAVRVGELLDEEKKTVAVPISKFNPDDRQRLHLVDMTEDDLRELPEYDPLFGRDRSEPGSD